MATKLLENDAAASSRPVPGYKNTPVQDHDTDTPLRDEDTTETSIHVSLPFGEEKYSAGDRTKNDDNEQGKTMEVPTDQYPHGARLAILVVAIALSTFLVALDSVCIRPSS